MDKSRVPSSSRHDQLYILGPGNSNSIYPHETTESRKKFACIPDVDNDLRLWQPHIHIICSRMSRLCQLWKKQKRN